MGNFAALRVRNHDARMIEQQPGRAVQFDLRFLVSRHCRNQGRFGLRQRALVLQHQSCSRSAQSVFLLLCIQRLAAQINRGLSGSHAGAVLLYGELRIPHFDADLVFQLLQPHLRLAIFQFRPDLRRLGHAIA